MKPRPKHVIFLGAGASFTSGYPIGQDLRLLMTSREYFRNKLEEIYPINPVSRVIPSPKGFDLITKCLNYFDGYLNPIEMFRDCNFATVDEFSELASGSFPEHVQAMKKLMCFILALYNPEKQFSKSDYYPFVQRLFRSDVPYQFREEITIITFNYDCYLDYVMRKTFYSRLKVSKYPVENIEFNEQWESKLSSGFFVQGLDTQRAIKQTVLAWGQNQFNYFKLHGSMAFAGSPIFGYENLYNEAVEKHFKFLDDEWFVKSYAPPIVFPWELFDAASGKFISEDDFIFVKGKDQVTVQQGKMLFNHFKIMWENAKHSVEQADKISFVGLSMHEYLKRGFRYLFQDIGKGKTPRLVEMRPGQSVEESGHKRVETVVANTENKIQFGPNRLHPASLCGKVSQLLMEVAPNMRYIRSSSEFDGIFSTDSPEKADDPDITPRSDFRQFIEREMD